MRWSFHAAVALLSLTAVLGLGGCGADDLGGFAYDDGGLPYGDAGATGPDAGGSPAACNTLQAAGPLVTPVKLTRALSFAGGTPVDGSYQLTSAEVASGFLPEADRRTIVISGSTLQFVRLSSGGETNRWSATYQTEEVRMTVTRTCGGAGAMQTWQYTATASSLLIKSGEVIYTYERR